MIGDSRRDSGSLLRIVVSIQRAIVANIDIIALMPLRKS